MTGCWDAMASTSVPVFWVCDWAWTDRGPTWGEEHQTPDAVEKAMQPNLFRDAERQGHTTMTSAHLLRHRVPTRDSGFRLVCETAAHHLGKPRGEHPWLPRRGTPLAHVRLCE